VPSSGSYQQQNFVGPTTISGAIRHHFHHKMLKFQITHQQVCVRIGAPPAQ